MAELSLISGPVPLVVLVLGAVALLVLLVLLVRRRRTAAVTVVAAVAVAAVILLGLNWVVTSGLQLFPEALPGLVTAWIAAGAAAVVLVVGNMVRTTTGTKLLALGSGVAVLLATGSQINNYFAQYPTLGALTGSAGEVSTLTGVKRQPSQSVASPVVSRWKGPATTPSQVVTATIPGTASGFTARSAYVYLPPAYTSPSPPLLPVLVLVSGQPGGPQDWVTAGNLQSLMDQFAAAHGGLAPVTVVVDPNGPSDTITMCMDSQIAKADTYLSQDVPNWIAAELGVDTNRARWAFGGFSYGGTCAIQMATRHTDLYPSFIDISGEREPAISADRTQTIQAAFGGNTAAFDALTPLTLLGQRRYPEVWGYFAAGGNDAVFSASMVEVSAAAQKAGMTVQRQVVAGQGHSWAVPNAALPPALVWLAPRLGLTAAPT